MRKCKVGGQAVLEGVMMKAPDAIAIAVRKEDGKVTTKYEKYTPLSKKHPWMGWPVIRGVVNFVEMLKIGMGTITYSAKVLGLEEEKPSKVDAFVAKKTGASSEGVMMGFAVLIALALMIGLFFILPTVLTRFIAGEAAGVLGKNLVEGGVRLFLFLGYIGLISLMKDIRRVFMYHGAEHKVIACYEHDAELTAENAMRYKRLHPRCGTNYLLLVMVVSILVLSLFGWTGNVFLRVGLRLVMLPFIAGLAYELLKAADRYDNPLTRVIRWPGMMLQKLTTREPDESMIEVAIIAFKMAMDYGAYMAETVLENIVVKPSAATGE